MVSEEEFNKCDAMRVLEGAPEERERIMKTACVKGNVTEFRDGSSIVIDRAMALPDHSASPLPFQCEKAEPAP